MYVENVNKEVKIITFYLKINDFVHILAHFYKFNKQKLPFFKKSLHLSSISSSIHLILLYYDNFSTNYMAKKIFQKRKEVKFQNMITFCQF